jgi:hypothetical protein
MAAVEHLKRRVTALEAAQNDTTQTLRWVVAKLGRMSAVQDEHTLRFDRIETDLKGLKHDLPSIITKAVDPLDNEVKTLRRDLPGIVAEVMRNVLRGHKG